VAPTFEPERALAAIRKHLQSLQALRGKNYQDAQASEQEWMHLAQSIIERTFGNPSSNLTKFYGAKTAGNYRMIPYGGGIPHGENQRNFEARIQACESFFRSCIAELELVLPEDELTGHYEPGQEYEFYRGIKLILGTANARVLIVDPYLGTDVFDQYAAAIDRNIRFRLLTNNLPQNVLTLAQKYASGGNLEVRTTTAIHDRVIFADQRVWLIGQSLKDAATKKPTYIVEHDGTLMGPTYENIWANAHQVI
jgi:hypothetical protein